VNDSGGALFEPVSRRAFFSPAAIGTVSQKMNHPTENQPLARSTGAMPFSELLFESIFNFTNYGIWIMDGDGVVLKVNPAAEKLIGVRARDVVGRKIMRLADVGVIDQALTPHILASKRPATKLLHVLKTNKQIMSSGMPFFDENGDIKLVVVNEYDMTTLNSLQVQLEDLRLMAEKYKDELSDLNLMELKQHGIIAESKEMKQVLQVSLKLARLDVSNILILGESGTGKGLVAQFIHDRGKRRDQPFIQVNCAALPESLLEAELFGFEKGAFTGASAGGKIGLFEMARNGTILLDEIGELPLALQAKLLKCLDDHEIMHIGGLQPIRINCTIIAATNRNLHLLVKENRFREDLFHRLNVFHIKLPPLRKRPEDVVALANYFLKKYNHKYNMKKRLSLKAINRLQTYPFSGNVRELKNILKHGVVISEDPILDNIVPVATDGDADIENRGLPSLQTGELGLQELLDNYEKAILTHARERCQTTRKMAAYLKTSQSRIARMLKKHEPSPKASPGPRA
jgi:transcriptional regulator with PAS, ATPase and Fis domain